MARPPCRAGLSDVVGIAAGASHSLALKADGTVVEWGGFFGQPTVPAGLGNVAGIAAGANHSLALKADGTVVAWGGFFGQPTVPAGLSNVAGIAAGDYHSLALMATEPGVSMPVLVSPRIALGGINTAFNFRIRAKNGAPSYGATGLPAGLSINAATGVITGTPTGGGG